MVNNNVIIENAELLYPNFKGKEVPPYNPEGCRNFCVYLPEELAEQMKDDGWNVKRKKPDDEDEEVGRPYIQVAVNFNGPYPPEIVAITSAGQRIITEETVATLDSLDMESVDIIIRPRNWSMPSGMNGVKAYLKTMYIVVAENPFTQKYAHIPIAND